MKALTQGRYVGREAEAALFDVGQGATMVSALWGLFLWKEFAGADIRVKSLLYVMMALFICGLGMVSLAPLYSR